MLWLILVIGLGMVTGIITGLIPGLHTNTIAIVVAGASAIMLDYLSGLEIAAFLLSMVVVHSFVDFIPSTFLGAPEGATVLGVLPGHELLMRGRGIEAIKLTIIGGVGAFAMGLIFIPIMFLWLDKGYKLLSVFIVPILAIFSVFFIAQERKLKKILWASIIFLLSGSLGLVVLNKLSVSQPLFPLLSGLFGVSTLFLSLFNKGKIPNQKTDLKVQWMSIKRLGEYLKASLSSLFVSILPAIGAAQAAVISRAFTKFREKKDFLVVVGGINTAAALFTLTTLFLIGKARTGVIAALKNVVELNFFSYLILVVAALISMVFGVVVTLKLGVFAAENISQINYRKVGLGVIIFLSILTIIFSGPIGLLILLVATSIGVLAPLSGVRRIHLMACLVIPVIIYYL